MQKQSRKLKLKYVCLKICFYNFLCLNFSNTGHVVQYVQWVYVWELIAPILTANILTNYYMYIAKKHLNLTSHSITFRMSVLVGYSVSPPSRSSPPTSCTPTGTGSPVGCPPVWTTRRDWLGGRRFNVGTAGRPRPLIVVYN